MRRFLFVALILAATAQAAPAAHAATPPPAPVAATAVAATNLIYHQDGYLSDKACWKRTSTGRIYCLVVAAWVSHEGNYSHASTWANCERSYGGVTVSTPCNWALGPYQLLRFGNAYGGAPAEVFTSGNPSDPDCRTGPVSFSGADRTVGFPGLSAYQLSRFSGVKVRFLANTGCGSLHLTNNYHFGSRRTNTETSPYPHTQATDPTYSGLHIIP